MRSLYNVLHLKFESVCQPNSSRIAAVGFVLSFSRRTSVRSICGVCSHKLRTKNGIEQIKWKFD